MEDWDCKVILVDTFLLIRFQGMVVFVDPRAAQEGKKWLQNRLTHPKPGVISKDFLDQDAQESVHKLGAFPISSEESDWHAHAVQGDVTAIGGLYGVGKARALGTSATGQNEGRRPQKTKTDSSRLEVKG